MHRFEHRTRNAARRALPGLAALALVVAAGAAAAISAPPAAAADRLVRISQGGGSAALADATPLSATSAAATVRISVVLKARNLTQLENEVAAGWQGDYLTTAQFAAEYGQPPAVIHSIEAYLNHYGLRTSAYRDGLDVTAIGTAGQINQAFSVKLHNFRTRVAGVTRSSASRLRTVRGTQQNPAVPSRLSGPILAILGLSSYAPATSQAVRARPHVVSTTSHALPSNIPAKEGLSPADFEKRYNLTPLENAGANGQGETVGIVTLASMNPATPFTFWNKYLGLKEPASRLKLIPVDGGAGPVSLASGSDETDLDVEQSGAIASKANVRVYEAPNTDPGFADAFFAAASDNVADTVSVSWGSSETFIDALIASSLEPHAYAQVFDEAFAELGAQGQSNFTASGDLGAYQAASDVGTTNLSAGTLASSPLTTATGATTLPESMTAHAQNANGQPTGATETATIPHEIAWGWDYFWPLWKALGEPSPKTATVEYNLGSSGGYSVDEPRPSYQRNVSAYNSRQHLIPTQFIEIAPGMVEPIGAYLDPSPGLKSGYQTVGRATPDLSTNGDPETGYAVFDQALFGGFAQFGGTSFVAPQLNGAAAVINSAVGHRVGFWNPVIYAAANGPRSPFTPINDTTVYRGPKYLSQTFPHSTKSYGLGGEFDSSNLFYTGRPGSTWNPAVGLGTPNLTAVAGLFGKG